MLIAEKQVCRDVAHHRDCTWQETGRYPDKRFNFFVGQAKARVRATGEGRRILNENHAELATVKLGHDDRIWVRITIRGAQLRNYLLMIRS